MPRLATPVALLLLAGMAWPGPAGSATTRIARGPEGQKAFHDLAIYYGPADRTPPYEAALDSLGSSNPTARRRAGAYLLGLFAQSLADESNGRAPWHATPYWGGPTESSAREFRSELAKAFGKQAGGTAALPVLAWLLAHEPVPSIQATGVAAMKRIGASFPDSLLRDVLAPAHPNVTVLLAALAEVASQRREVLAPLVLTLRHHHRRAVREAAQEAAVALGLALPPGPEPPPSLPPFLVQELHAIAAMTFPKVPSHARWARFEAVPDSAQRGTSGAATDGWLIEEDAARYRILDAFGRERSLTRSSTRIADWSLAREAESMLVMRSRGEVDAFSVGGAITAQFEPRGISTPEALVAAWSLERGDTLLAARVILPRLDALEDDRQLTPAIRSLLGTAYDKEMLKAFSYARDYECTLALARHLSSPAFAGFPGQARARQLAAQLAARREDFVSFVLPDSAAWDSLRGTLDRAARVGYLARRLRLLNAFQWGQPGGVSLHETQYEKPWFKQSPWDEVTNSSRRLINPLQELERLDLTIADIPLLASFLADSSYLPTFEFWRDFAPDWRLIRVGELIEDLINRVAHRTLAHASEVAALDAAGRAAYLRRLVDWSRGHARMSAADLDLEVLCTTTSGSEFVMAARQVAAANDLRAVPIILKRMDRFPTCRRFVLESLHALDSPLAVPKARDLLRERRRFDAIDFSRGNLDASAEWQCRYYAALTLIRHGDRSKHEGFAELQRLLLGDRSGYFWKGAAPVLREADFDDPKTVLCGDWRPLQLDLANPEDGEALHRMFRAGCETSYQYLLRNLQSDGHPAWTYELGPPTAVPGRFEAIRVRSTDGDRAATLIAWWLRAPQPYDMLAPEAERAKRRAELAAWLSEQFRRIRAGVTPEMQ